MMLEAKMMPGLQMSPWSQQSPVGPVILRFV